MEILLKTNDAHRYPGFEGVVICYDPLVVNRPECTRRENRKRNTGVSSYSTAASIDEMQ